MSINQHARVSLQRLTYHNDVKYKDAEFFFLDISNKEKIESFEHPFKVNINGQDQTFKQVTSGSKSKIRIPYEKGAWLQISNQQPFEYYKSRDCIKIKPSQIGCNLRITNEPLREGLELDEVIVSLKNSSNLDFTDGMFMQDMNYMEQLKNIRNMMKEPIVTGSSVAANNNNKRVIHGIVPFASTDVFVANEEIRNLLLCCTIFGILNNAKHHKAKKVRFPTLDPFFRFSESESNELILKSSCYWMAANSDSTIQEVKICEPDLKRFRILKANFNEIFQGEKDKITLTTEFVEIEVDLDSSEGNPFSMAKSNSMQSEAMSPAQPQNMMKGDSNISNKTEKISTGAKITQASIENDNTSSDFSNLILEDNDSGNVEIQDGFKKSYSNKEQKPELKTKIQYLANASKVNQYLPNKQQENIIKKEAQPKEQLRISEIKKESSIKEELKVQEQHLDSTPKLRNQESIAKQNKLQDSKKREDAKFGQKNVPSSNKGVNGNNQMNQREAPKVKDKYSNPYLMQGITQQIRPQQQVNKHLNDERPSKQDAVRRQQINQQNYGNSLNQKDTKNENKKILSYVDQLKQQKQQQMQSQKANQMQNNVKQKKTDKEFRDYYNEKIHEHLDEFEHPEKIDLQELDDDQAKKIEEELKKKEQQAKLNQQSSKGQQFKKPQKEQTKPVPQRQKEEEKVSYKRFQQNTAHYPNKGPTMNVQTSQKQPEQKQKETKTQFEAYGGFEMPRDQPQQRRQTQQPKKSGGMSQIEILKKQNEDEKQKKRNEKLVGKPSAVNNPNYNQFHQNTAKNADKQFRDYYNEKIHEHLDEFEHPEKIELQELDDNADTTDVKMAKVSSIISPFVPAEEIKIADKTYITPGQEEITEKVPKEGKKTNIKDQKAPVKKEETPKPTEQQVEITEIVDGINENDKLEDQKARQQIEEEKVKKEEISEEERKKRDEEERKRIDEEEKKNQEKLKNREFQPFPRYDVQKHGDRCIYPGYDCQCQVCQNDVERENKILAKMDQNLHHQYVGNKYKCLKNPLQHVNVYYKKHLNTKDQYLNREEKILNEYIDKKINKDVKKKEKEPLQEKQDEIVIQSVQADGLTYCDKCEKLISALTQMIKCTKCNVFYHKDCCRDDIAHHFKNRIIINCKNIDYWLLKNDEIPLKSLFKGKEIEQLETQQRLEVRQYKHRDKLLPAYERITSNLLGQIFDYFDVMDCYFRISRLNRWTWKQFYEYSKSQFSLLRELNEHVIKEKIRAPDGVYKFKRELIIDQKLHKICLYSLYCTNLNNKALTDKDFLSMKDYREFNGQILSAYNFNDQTVQAISPRYVFKFSVFDEILNQKTWPKEKQQHCGKVWIYDTIRKEIKEMDWMMNKFNDEISIFENEDQEDICMTAQKNFGGQTEWKLIVYERFGREVFYSLILKDSKSRRYGQLQPKSYLEINEDNISQFSYQKPLFGVQTLTSKFTKIAIRIVKLKNGSFKEQIDCGDFKFAKTISDGGQENPFMVIQDINNTGDSYIYLDHAIYGHCFSKGTRAKAVIDLSDTPFEIDDSKNEFKEEGKTLDLKIDKDDSSNQFQKLEIVGENLANIGFKCDGNEKIPHVGNAKLDWSSKEYDLLTRVKLLDF